jgi:hypothetical protein
MKEKERKKERGRTRRGMIKIAGRRKMLMPKECQSNISDSWL